MARRRKQLKKTNQIFHAKCRIKERFNIDISDEQYNQLVAQIKKGLSEFIRHTSCRVALHWVQYQDIKIPAVYDRRRKTIVTVLKPEWVHDETYSFRIPGDDCHA